MEKKILERNTADTSKDTILDQMNEPRALPMGRDEFLLWSHRIITGALIPDAKGMTVQDYEKKMLAWEEGPEDYINLYESQKFALANMLMHLGPTESHKPDAFFIHSLRKFAVNQVADTIRKELHEAAKARTSAKEAAEKQPEEEKAS